MPSLYAAEEAGGWNVGMRTVARALLANVPLPFGPILELGCGGGAFAIELAQSHLDVQVFGLDLRGAALAFAQSRSRRVTWLQGDLLQLPFAGPTFALIAALDVVDQQGVDAGAALTAIHELLLPGGVTLLRVSAHAWLYGPHDIAFGTGRRYSRSAFVALVRSAGLTPLRVTYANSLLAPAVTAVRLLQQHGLLPFSQELYEEGIVHRMVGAALMQEARWLKRYNLMWGLSLLVVARKAWNAADGQSSQQIDEGMP
ncbi:MAG: class I SAM-dependent methyltransferase [Caldilinea sp.]|nr:class I SAM-dependent methyltransferase [Caldilinea sp.]MDW8439072.1 class I SAM-dependent methyltransferase [Caldilineaceae bacterium]